MEKETEDRVREMAYLMWEQAGRQMGMAAEFWLAAEREVLRTMSAIAGACAPGKPIEADTTRTAATPEAKPNAAQTAEAKAADAAAPEIKTPETGTPETASVEVQATAEAPATPAKKPVAAAKAATPAVSANQDAASAKPETAATPAKKPRASTRKTGTAKSAKPKTS